MQLKRELGMGSYQSAWRMLHQIRKAMEKEEYKETFEAIVEIDETYVGGKPRKDNNHSDDNKDNSNENKTKRGRGTSKTPVIGVKERNTGKVHAVVANYNEEGKQLSGKQLFNVLKKVCKKNTTQLCTVEDRPYRSFLARRWNPHKRNREFLGCVETWRVWRVSQRIG